MQYLKIVTFILTAVRVLYWIVGEHTANKLIPKAKHTLWKQKAVTIATYAYWIFFLVQLIGLNILLFTHSTLLQLFGFLIFLVGVFISIKGRIDLGINWAHGGEYQIKTNQSLVTSGIYKYIRHPIYAGVMFMIVGGQLVVESYLVIPLTLLYYTMLYFQTRKEERLLTAYFGHQYVEYMKHTPRIFPRIFEHIA